MATDGLQWLDEIVLDYRTPEIRTPPRKFVLPGKGVEKAEN